METNLPANLQDIDALMKLTGIRGDFTPSPYPTVRVNYDDQDDDGNAIPRGKFSLYTDEGTRVFADTIQFRIMMVAKRYQHYSKELQKVVSTSVYFQKFTNEIPDDIGGNKCGKVSKKLLPQLSAEEQLAQKEIQLSQVIFGLVSAVGKDTKGNDVIITEKPATYFARGSTFMPAAEYLEELDKKNILPFSIVTNISLKREKNNNVTFWMGVFTPGEKLEVGNKEIAFLKEVLAYIKGENDIVVDKWRSAKTKQGRPEMKLVANGLDDDINDLIEGQSDDIVLAAG